MAIDHTLNSMLAKLEELLTAPIPAKRGLYLGEPDPALERREAISLLESQIDYYIAYQPGAEALAERLARGDYSGVTRDEDGERW